MICPLVTSCATPRPATIRISVAMIGCMPTADTSSPFHMPQASATSSARTIASGIGKRLTCVGTPSWITSERPAWERPGARPAHRSTCALSCRLRDELVDVLLVAAAGQLADLATVAQHRDAMRDPHDLVDLGRDEQHRHALAGQAQDLVDDL